MHCSIKILLLLLLVSCRGQHYKIPDKNLRPKEGLISIEGRFIKIEKFNEYLYDLYLELNRDTFLFKTYMPIGNEEIKRLKKDGINTRLTFEFYENPVTKTKERMVRSMTPLYDL